MNHRLMTILALVMTFSDVALAQEAFTAVPNDRQPSCRQRASSLLEDVTRTKWLIQHGTGRSPAETCKLVGEYGLAERKLIEFLTSEEGIRCGITANTAAQMKEGHRKAQTYRERVCLDARQWPSGHPVVSDFGDPAFGFGGRR